MTRERASEALDDLSRHRAERVSDGIIYRMTPGRMEMIACGRDGDSAVTLAHFSAVIVAETSDLEAPDAVPVRTLTLSVVEDGAAHPRRVDVPASRYARMEWPECLLGARAAVASGRTLRDRLRLAIQLLSQPVASARYMYSGWARHLGLPVYVTSRAAIGASGAVADVSSRLPVPADRIALPPPPEGDDRRRAMRALVDLASVEPAEVVLPALGLAFRAVMGVSRATVHIAGRKGLGKSMLAGLVASLFGPALVDRPIASWADGSSSNGISRTLAVVGDALVVIDDLRVGGMRDDASFESFDRVVRAHHNRAAPRKLTREGVARNDPPSRASILSTGEVLPHGHSTRDRVVSVYLDARPAPDAETFARARDLSRAGSMAEANHESSLARLHRAARDGELAAAMSAYVAWYAPQYDARVERLTGLELDAARRWGLGESDRAAGLLGALALGLDSLFEFVADVGAVGADELAAMRERAREAMSAVARAHTAIVEEEDPARRAMTLLAEALASQAAHVMGLHPPPTGGTCTPRAAHLLGWRQERRGGELVMVPGGVHIGYLARSEAELDLLPGPTYTLLRERAQREGRALALDKDGLGDALRAAGYLARVPPDTRRGDAVKVHVAGREMRLWALRLDAIGVVLPPPSDTGAAGVGEGPPSEGG